jgi:hypothetical protein
VSVSWLAHEVRSGKIRWVLGEQSSGGGGRGLPGDTRSGAEVAMAAVAKACKAVTLSSSGSGATEAAGIGTGTGTGTGAGTGAGTGTGTGGAGRAAGTAAATTLYDCRGRAQALTRSGT